MSDYSIALSGLAAAQKAFDVIGNNIANAATKGYHRQRLELSPAFSLLPGNANFIGGVNIEGISRLMDTLLEQEILRQNSALADTSHQTAILGTIEATFGEFAGEDLGLNVAIDNFFNALQDLSSQPEGDVWQNQILSEAQTMTTQFQSIGRFFDQLQRQIKLEAELYVEDINTLIQQIADLNGQIERIEILGGQANSMIDKRDQCIMELSELINVETIQRDYGVVDVSAGGFFVVTRTVPIMLQAGYNDNAQLGLAVSGTSNYTTTLQGGKLGALLSLHNQTVKGYINDLDTLAQAIISQVNSYHTTGIGLAGSFTEWTGQALTTGDLSNIENIVDGTFYIRLTDTTTGQMTRHAITVDTANDTLADIAAAVSAISGLSASVNSSNQFSIIADTGYTFDFVPAVLPKPTVTDFDDPAAPTVTVTGLYEGAQNDTFDFTVIGDGAVGNGTLSLEVRNNSGELITSLNIGSGYAAGDWLEIGNGLKIALSMGNLAQSSADTFSIDAYADTDTSGFLAATGINTFFSGSSASDIAVSSSILDNPDRIATSIGPGGMDNGNVVKMAALKDAALPGLGNLTCTQFYQKLVTDIGQDYSVKQMQQESIETILMNLETRRNDISGVDINEEAAELLIFEQMFQAMTHYMTTTRDAVQSLMELL